jgi:hypothetical protein
MSVFLVAAAFGLTSVAAWAQVPPCLDHGTVLPADNARIVLLKKTAEVGKTIRAHASGRVSRVFPDQHNSHGTTHVHFEIRLDNQPDPSAVLEVVYSEDDGLMPNPAPGAQVEACGDFINASAPNGGYGASPSGAIIHWVHQTDTPNHDAGFVVMDGVLYGYGNAGH